MMTFRKLEFQSILKPLVFIPLLVVLIVLSVRACLEMVLVLRMPESYGIFSDPLYETYSAFTDDNSDSSSSSPPSYQTHPVSRSPRAFYVIKERSQFGWNSGRSSSKDNNNQSPAVAVAVIPNLKEHIQKFYNVDFSSSSSSSQARVIYSKSEDVSNVETSFLTNIMVVSLL